MTTAEGIALMVVFGCCQTRATPPDCSSARLVGTCIWARLCNRESYGQTGLSRLLFKWYLHVVGTGLIDGGGQKQNGGFTLFEPELRAFKVTNRLHRPIGPVDLKR